MRILKILVVNILIFFLLVLSFELSLGITRIILGKDFLLPSFYKSNDISSDFHPCMKMKTDVILSHVPDHNYECNPKGGYIIDEYVLYPASEDNLPVILILGGSTSSGFYQHYSEGETWPRKLSILLKDKFQIINGGVGGYSSLQEFYKLVKDSSRLKNLNFVISLNGINEMKNYQGLFNFRDKNYPFISEKQYIMNQNQTWIDQRVSKFRLILPNLYSFYKYIFASKISTSETKPNDKNQIFNLVNNVNRWEINVKRMKALAEIENSKYIVFLQPTLGVGETDIDLPKDSTDYKILKENSGDYLNEIRFLYKELRSRCKKLSFCIDLSNAIPPNGDNYFDLRHLNKNGNHILAKKIFDKLKNFTY